MELGSSYFHRLMDLAQPLGPRTTGATPLASPLTPPLIPPLEVLEEIQEKEISFDHENFKEGLEFSEENSLQNPLPKHEAPSSHFPEEALRVQKPELRQEFHVEKTKAFSTLDLHQNQTALTTAETPLEAGSLPFSNLRRESFIENAASVVFNPHDQKSIDQENFLRRTMQTRLQATVQTSTQTSAVEEFFEKIMTSPQEHHLEEDLSWRPQKEKPLRSGDFQEQGELMGDFTLEQKQTLQHFIHVAIEGFEKTKPERNETSSFLKPNPASLRPPWRGWTGRGGFPGRIK